MCFCYCLRPWYAGRSLRQDDITSVKQSDFGRVKSTDLKWMQWRQNPDVFVPQHESHSENTGCYIY